MIAARNAILSTRLGLKIYTPATTSPQLSCALLEGQG